MANTIKKTGLHIHTLPNQYLDADFEFDTATMKDYVAKNSFDAVAITNHNRFNKDQFLAILTEQPQRDREGTLAGRRLGQVRRGRRRIREEDEAHEQLLLVPQALLRVAQRDKVRQARGLRGLLPLPLEPRQETRPKGDRRLPVQPGLRDAEKRHFLKLVLKSIDGMGLPHPSFAGISSFCLRNPFSGLHLTKLVFCCCSNNADSRTHPNNYRVCFPCLLKYQY